MQTTFSIAQRAVVAALLVFASGWYVYSRTHRPSPALVNGTYSNPCCDDVRLIDGVLVAGQARVPFRLERMKFGLIASPAKQVEVIGHEVTASGDRSETNILFSRDGAAFTLCSSSGCQQEYQFSRR